MIYHNIWSKFPPSLNKLHKCLAACFALLSAHNILYVFEIIFENDFFENILRLVKKRKEPGKRFMFHADIINFLGLLCSWPMLLCWDFEAEWNALMQKRVNKVRTIKQNVFHDMVQEKVCSKLAIRKLNFAITLWTSFKLLNVESLIC